VTTGPLPRLGDPAVQAMHLVEVDPVGAEALEACPGGGLHTFAGEPEPRDLGRDDDRRSRRQSRERATEDPLRLPRAVALRGIEQRDAQLGGPGADRSRLCGAEVSAPSPGRRAELPAAK